MHLGANSGANQRPEIYHKINFHSADIYFDRKVSDKSAHVLTTYDLMML